VGQSHIEEIHGKMKREKVENTKENGKEENDGNLKRRDKVSVKGAKSRGNLKRWDKVSVKGAKDEQGETNGDE
jgi:hypothetical protein